MFIPDLTSAQRALLAAMAAGQRLKDHRDIDGRKRYALHQADDAETPVHPADVAALVEAGLISSNKKFPAATYWLTEAGRGAVALGASA